jgi:hypothetical protein
VLRDAAGLKAAVVWHPAQRDCIESVSEWQVVHEFSLTSFATRSDSSGIEKLDRTWGVESGPGE